MAFPVVAAQDPTVDSAVGGAASGGDTANTFHNFTIPASTVDGDLLILFGRAAGAGAVSITFLGTATWTLVQDSSDASDDVTFWAYAPGFTADASLAVGVNHGSARCVGVILRITGAADPSTRAPETSTVAIGTSTTPNPTTCTPTGGAKDYLWLWLGAWDGEQTLSKTAVTNYSSGDVDVSCGTAGATTANCQLKFGYRTNNAASEDPGTCTLSVAPTGWTAWTLAVHPADTTPKSLLVTTPPAYTNLYMR